MISSDDNNDGSTILMNVSWVVSVENRKLKITAK